jgi:hypothetical protein
MRIRLSRVFYPTGMLYTLGSAPLENAGSSGSCGGRILSNFDLDIIRFTDKDASPSLNKSLSIRIGTQ